MIQSFMTYVYALNGLHDYFDRFWDIPYEPETCDIYGDKEGYLKEVDDMVLFDFETRATLDDFIIKMEDFLEWSEDLRLSDEEFGNSARWKLVQESSKSVFTALDKYMRGMGIIPGGIYKIQRKYSELRLKK